MAPGNFWVLKSSFMKKNAEHLQNERVKETLLTNRFFEKN